MTKRLTVVVAALALFAGCSGESDSTADGKLNVVTTTGMIGDAAAVIGGEHVQVTTLMGPGVDPHLFKASEGDVRRLADADLILYNGLHLEAKLGDVLAEMRSRVETVPVAEVVAETDRLTPPEYEGAFDPHVWFDVRLWSQVVERVRDALIDVDETHADVYRSRSAEYLATLTKLHADVTEQASTVPADRRVLITAHDAFNYFGNAYGFEVRGLQGMSTEAEAGAGDVKALAEFISERRIPAIFVESSVSPRAIEAVQAAVASRGFRVTIGGELFSDALGSPGTGAETYVGMVRHNIDAIVSALSADVQAAR